MAARALETKESRDRERKTRIKESEAMAPCIGAKDNKQADSLSRLIYTMHSLGTRSRHDPDWDMMPGIPDLSGLHR